MDKNGEKRPWGFFENLAEGADHKVKRITVYPGQRLSLQLHRRRAEHWYIVSGEAEFTLDETVRTLRSGDSVDIGLGQSHRIRNTGTVDLVFVEVQTGDYFGEDDIERIHDDYERE